MKPMNYVIEFVQSFNGEPVLGTTIVDYFQNQLELSAHICAGCVGSAVKFGHIRVVGTKKVDNKTVNLFL
ncbi:hypothetical protein [Clostridium sp. ZS1]|uniref:hypothetical protein n=1 Tax=Clostridium sp. ZS1 TaxID=2949989 RepID=UPI001DED6D68|nr:hypothetical protein [Clostridium sp. ZS1]MBN1067585.1 hypothetical protein [Clostridium botulinum]